MMHTTRKRGKFWEVIFVITTNIEVIAVYEKEEDAFGICSYLNGGLPPAGYTMAVQQVGS